MNKNILVGSMLLLLISACSTPTMKADGAEGKKGMKGTESITIENIDEMVTYNNKSTVKKLVIDCSKCSN